MSSGCSIPIAKMHIGEAEAQEGPMTVLIYVDTSKQVGDPEHLKVFATRTPRKHGSRKTIPKASPLSTR